MDWIAVEWDQQALRLWGMQGVTVEARHSLPLDLSAGDFLDAGRLGQLVARTFGAADLPLIGAGPMREGAASVPARLPSARRVQCDSWPGPVHLLPGLTQDSPADLLDGEQARIAGLLAQDARFDGVICLIGAQTRWLRISAEEVVSFQSTATGGLAGALSRPPVFAPQLGADWRALGFDEAVADALSRPQAFAARLHQISAEARLQGLAPEAATARLWGLLIGLDLAATRPYWLGQEVVVIGADAARAPYVAAMTAQGVWLREEDGAAMALAGLTATRQAVSGAGHTAP